MKVLRIVGGLDPAFGGPSVSSINAAIAGQRAGIETTVTFPAARGGRELDGLHERLGAAGIAWVEFPLLSRPRGVARRLGLSPALGRWLHRARDRFDVLHCHGAWVLPTLCAWQAARRGPVAVLTPHESLTDFDIAQSRNPATRSAKGWLRRRYLNGFDLVVFASALEARDSLPPGEEARAQSAVIPHPVFDERVHRPAPHRAMAAGAPLTLGFIGRLHAKKNVGVLLRALARLPEDVRLVVAGDGPEAAGLRALAAECGVGGRIEWLGFVQGEAKAAFFRRIDLLAMPSDYECFGMAAAEALAEGVPAIVSPRTGIAEIVGRHGGGLVVPPEPEALAGAIETFLHNPDALLQYAGRAADAAGHELSFGVHGAQLRRAYEEAAARRIPQPPAPDRPPPPTHPTSP